MSVSKFTERRQNYAVNAKQRIYADTGDTVEHRDPFS